MQPAGGVGVPELAAKHAPRKRRWCAAVAGWRALGGAVVSCPPSSEFAAAATATSATTASAAALRTPSLRGLAGVADVQLDGTWSHGTPILPPDGPEARPGRNVTVCGEPGTAMGVYDDKLRDFLTHLQLERGASPHTVEAYRRDLIDLGDFVEHSDPDTIPVSVLDDYTVALRDRGLSAATVRRRMAAVRAFFKHRAREGGRADAGRTVPLPRLGRSLPDPLTKAEAEAIVTRPDTSPRGLRDRAMLELLYGAGLRVSELVSLRVSDIDLAEGVVRCTGKGAKQRMVPMGKSSTEATRIYLQRGRPVPGPAAARRHPVPEPPRPGHHPPGGLPARPRPCPQRRHHQGRDPAHPAPLVRDPPARGRLRPAQRAGDARPRQHRDDPGVHPRLGRPRPPGVLQSPPPRLTPTGDSPPNGAASHSAHFRDAVPDDLRDDLLKRIPWVGGHADVWRTFSDERFFPRLVAALADPYRADGVTKVAGIEARGLHPRGGRGRRAVGRLRRDPKGRRALPRREDRPRLGAGLPRERLAPCASRCDL